MTKNYYRESTPTELVIKDATDINSCVSTHIGFKGIFSDLYKNIFAGIDLKSRSNQILQDLAIMRIVNPKSKRYTANESSNYGFDLNLDSIYKAMDRIDDDIIQQIKHIAYRNTKRLLNIKESDDLDLLFYDLTTLSFETNCQNALREFGFSKDGKHQHVQIMLALIITKSGLPVGYELFCGNMYEGNTLIPTLKGLKEKYKINKVIVVADSGLISKNNVDQIKDIGFDYIIGGRIKNSPKQIKEEVFNQSGYEDLNEDMRCKVYDICEKNRDKLLIYHSKKRAAKDLYDRNKSLEKIMKQVGKDVKSMLSGALKKSYVKLSEDAKIEIDQDKLEEIAKFDGYFSLQTNVKDFKMMEIIDHYRGLWQIEQTFRISKYNLKIRPVFHYSVERIKAHFAICYVALVILRTLEYTMIKNNCYTPIEQLFSLLDKVIVTSISSKGNNYNICNDFPEELIPIYKCTKTKIPPRFLSLTK